MCVDACLQIQIGSISVDLVKINVFNDQITRYSVICHACLKFLESVHDHGETIIPFSRIHMATDERFPWRLRELRPPVGLYPVTAAAAAAAEVGIIVEAAAAEVGDCFDSIHPEVPAAAADDGGLPPAESISDSLTSADALPSPAAPMSLELASKAASISSRSSMAAEEFSLAEGELREGKHDESFR